MEKWVVIFFALAALAISIYGLNATLNMQRENRADIERSGIGTNLTQLFDENFKRQNVLGNVTVQPIIKLETDIKSLLENRTARFDAIQEKQDIIIANERTIIHNQYIYSLPDNLNVTGISNETR